MKLLQTITVWAAVACLVLLSAATAQAGPLDPSYRGAPNSVHVIFDHGLRDFASFGPSTWNMAVFETGPSNYPLDQTPPSASGDETHTTIILPNFIDPLPLKLMRIQMSFEGPVSGDLLGFDLIAHDPVQTSWIVVGGSGTGFANFHWVDIEIRPNPDWEEIIIPFGSFENGFIAGNLWLIEIDTVSIPEPATLSLLAIGGLALLRRKRST